MSKPLILVTNDDGITAPGLRNLIRYLAEFGEIVVVAPDSPQSGKGHAITVDDTLFLNEVPADDGATREYSCSGTPADCVKLALRELLDRKPDLCVSGINHGSNASINVIYSGTMSAAIEAGIEGIPSIGFSLCDFAWEADFGPAETFIKKNRRRVARKRYSKRRDSQREYPQNCKGHYKRCQGLPSGTCQLAGKIRQKTEPLGKRLLLAHRRVRAFGQWRGYR